MSRSPDAATGHRAPLPPTRDRGARLGGRPVWAHLLVLVLVPLLGLGALGTAVVRDSLLVARQARSADRLVLAIGQLDRVRAAVTSEVMPTLVRAGLSSPGSALWQAVPPAQREGLLATAAADVAAARARTDAALAAVPAGSPARADAQSTAVVLRATRSAADGGHVAPQVVADGLLRACDQVASAQRRVVVAAGVSATSTGTAQAVGDVQRAVSLAQAAGQQLPLLLTARLSDAAGARAADQRWTGAFGEFTASAGRPEDLSTAALRVAWRDVLADPSFAALQLQLAAQATAPEADRLGAGQVLLLVRSSALRDRALSALLQRTVAASVVAAHHDEQEAAERLHLALALCAVTVLVSCAVAALLGWGLSRRLRGLAAVARQVSRGLPSPVVATGPAELRTIAGVLADAADGLRGVQRRADLIADGDLQAVLAEPPLPGPLGAVVQASVSRIVATVHQRQALQAELVHQADHDALTGLASRSRVLRDLHAAVAGDAARTPVGLLLLDLEGFRRVNDSAGHAAGDELLRAVAHRLRAETREGDVVGRMGGDEFVVLAADAADPGELLALAERLRDALGRPVALDGGATAAVGVAVGVTSAAAGAAAPDALLAEAEAALARAARDGSGVQLFDDGMRREAADREHLTRALAQALAQGELTLAYQPVVDARSGDLTGFEALARWVSAEHGPVSPAVFVPLAEESDLVADLGRWALAEAARQLVRWRADGGPLAGPGGEQVSVAVNLSGRHLADPCVVDDVRAALAASGLPASLLVVEITETVLLDHEVAAARLTALRELGVRTALDDFGTGYTAIGQLRRAPADALKIDRSFTSSADPADHLLVRVVTSAAHAVGMTVVAEGVETPEERERVREAGCDRIQGYLASRPLAAADVPGWVSGTAPDGGRGSRVRAAVDAP